MKRKPEQRWRYDIEKDTNFAGEKCLVKDMEAARLPCGVHKTLNMVMTMTVFTNGHVFEGLRRVNL